MPCLRKKSQGIYSDDIRITTKKEKLYVFFMDWPANNQITIKRLSIAIEQRVGRIDYIELLGFGKVDFTRVTDGLKVMLPSQMPCELAFALRISGKDIV